ncbi:MASE1 domain-containing protein [Streptomyces sp. NPDC002520]
MALACHAHHVRLRRSAVAVLEMCAITALYFGSARLGLLQQLVRGQVTPLWPPTGIALASLLLCGRRVWPAIALGAFLVNVMLGPSVPAVLMITVGNTLAPICSYALLRHVGFHNRLDRLRDALSLIFLGAFTGTLVSATTGTAALVLAGALRRGDFWPTWSVWWTGDAMGVLVVTPVLLMLRSVGRPQDLSPYRWAEGLLLVAATVGIGFVETGRTPLLFIGFPLLIWAAFRFQPAGAALCALAVSTYAIIAAGQRTGPFAGHNLLTNMITLQAFNGAAALTALMLSAVVSERNQAQREIARACAQLAGMAAEIATGGHSAMFPAGTARRAAEAGKAREAAEAGRPRHRRRLLARAHHLLRAVQYQRDQQGAR